MIKRLAALLLLVSVASAALDLTGQSGLDVLNSLNQIGQASLVNQTNKTNQTFQLDQNRLQNLTAPNASNQTGSLPLGGGSNLWSWGKIPLGHQLTDGQLISGPAVENLSKMETPTQALESTGAYEVSRASR